jgi:hypothetical protein
MNWIKELLKKRPEKKWVTYTLMSLRLFVLFSLLVTGAILMRVGNKYTGMFIMILGVLYLVLIRLDQV